MATMTPNKKTPTTKGHTTQAASGASGKMVDPIRVVRQNTWLLCGAFVCGSILGLIFFVVALFFFPSYRGSVVFELSPDLAGADSVLSSDHRSGDIVTRLAKTETSRVLSQGVLSAALEKRDIRKTEWAQQFYEEGVL